MRIALYEHTTGGGRYSHAADPDSAPHALASAEPAIPTGFEVEGLAMVLALAEDFTRAGAAVELLWDVAAESNIGPPAATLRTVASLADRDRQLAQAAATADWTVLIAPELDGALAEVCRAVDAAGARRLGPSVEFVAVATDKHRTAVALAARGIPAPEGRLLERGERLPRDFSYPAVWKPCDGAGSHEVRLVPRAGALLEWNPPLRPDARRRLERFCPGLPASVAVLCGPGQYVPLTPCRQLLASDGTFAYQGGAWPLAGDLVERAQHLAVEAVAAIPGALGYVGVDLVLGADAQGSEDVVIEINPRLTTSYVGLREAYETNLAQAMLAIAAGQEISLHLRDVDELEFTAAGTVRCGK